MKMPEWISQWCRLELLAVSKLQTYLLRSFCLTNFVSRLSILKLSSLLYHWFIDYWKAIKLLEQNEWSKAIHTIEMKWFVFLLRFLFFFGPKINCLKRNVKWRSVCWEITVDKSDRSLDREQSQEASERCNLNQIL